MFFVALVVLKELFLSFVKMASLKEAFSVINGDISKRKNIYDDGTIGYAYGPQCTNGVSCLMRHELRRDPETLNIYIHSGTCAREKEFLTDEGRVVGNDDKSYIIRYA